MFNIAPTVFVTTVGKNLKLLMLKSKTINDTRYNSHKLELARKLATKNVN